MVSGGAVRKIKMKRTRRINILRSIRSSLNRFLSIVAIVALGSGFLAGLYAASPDMFETADSYLDDYRLYDLDIKAPVGFTEDDAAAVAALPGVEALLAARPIWYWKRRTSRASPRQRALWARWVQTDFCRLTASA